MFCVFVCHVVSIPKCIASYVQCSLGRIWEVYTCFDTKSFWHKWKSILTETHIKSIRYKQKSFRSKSELEEISQWKSFHLCIAYVSYWSKECHSRRRKIMFARRSRNFFHLLNSVNFFCETSLIRRKVRWASQCNKSSSIALQFLAWKFYNNFRLPGMVKL